MKIGSEQILNSLIQIKSSDIYRTRNIGGLILHKLKKYEGKCLKYGYILPDETELINKSQGKIRNIDGKSIIEYNVTYKIKSILPAIGEKYDCIINNITKMGLICYIEIGGIKDLKSSPILIIIPKEYCEIEKQREGFKINIEVLDKRIKYLSSQIQIIGKIID